MEYEKCNSCTCGYGALGSIKMKLGDWLEKLDITLNRVVLQETTLLKTARILRKIFEY